MIFGLLIVLLGVAALLSALGYIAIGFWQLFWPLLLIVLGIKMIMGSWCCRRSKDGKCDGKNCKMWSWHCHHNDHGDHGHDHGKEQATHDGQM